MTPMNAVKGIIRKPCFKPFQRFGNGKRVFIVKKHFGVIADGLYPDNVSRYYCLKAFIGGYKKLYHDFYFIIVNVNPELTLIAEPWFILSVRIVTLEFICG